MLVSTSQVFLRGANQQETVTGAATTPRSYLVHTGEDGGVLRRNRRDLIMLPGALPQPDEDKDPGEDNQLPVHVRQRRRPRYFQDYVEQ